MNLTHNPTTAKAQEAESETPPPIQLSKSTADHHTPKSLSFTNGVLKRHHQPNTPAVVLPVIYKECQKNHAASLGGHALDGCGEFMPSPTSTPTDPTSLKCAACGCHRNFHRRDPEEPSLYLDFPHHHYHHPPPPPSVTARERSPNSSSPSPPPLSSSYYTSAPHMLLALSSRPSDNHQVVNNNNHQVAEATTLTTPTTVSPNGRKRFRTRFSQGQKERMFAFAERLGWKMQKRDEVLVEEFCNEVGVGKSVLKVWMHNNKHSSGKRENANNNITSPHVGTTNGSSSSS